MFSSDGNKLRSFGRNGSGKGQFILIILKEWQWMVHEGNILVVDSGNKCIQKFTSSGRFLNVTIGMCSFLLHVALHSIPATIR